MNAKPLDFGQASATAKGALWMAVSAVCMTAMVCLVRISTEELHPFQVAFFRNLFGVVLFLPWLLFGGREGLKIARIGLYGIRACLRAVAIPAWFYAISVMAVAEAVALNFTRPLFVMVGAVLFLGEGMFPRRWKAAAVAFLGVLVIIRPDLDGIQPAALLVLLSATLLAGAVLITKVLLRTDASGTVHFYSLLLLIPLSLMPALFVWQWPDSRSLLMMFGVALVSSLGGYCSIRAFKAADTSAVMPFSYLRLPLAALMGYLLFAETMDKWNWMGAAIITTAMVWLFYRETRPPTH